MAASRWARCRAITNWIGRKWSKPSCTNVRLELHFLHRQGSLKGVSADSAGSRYRGRGAFRSLRARHWYVISHNRRIRYTPNERDAVVRAGVGLFLVIGKVPFTQLAQNFVNTRKRIERVIERHRRPFIAKVYRPEPRELKRVPTSPGRVELWLESDD